MQDIHSVRSGGGGGRLFGGSGGDRRLRQHHHHLGHGPQALKCPRCDSSNTKFCYYNNYNLSQPRHFCKSCRRYWTKGGVLRNVPVGGGCRKTKRSKAKSSSKNRSSDAGERKPSNSQNSSSESSSLTASTTAANTTATRATAAAAAAPVTAVEELSGINSTNSAPTLLNFQRSSPTGIFSIPQPSTPNPSFDPTLLDHTSAGNNMFPEIGTFTSLITSSTSQLPLRFNISDDISPFRLHDIVENSNANVQQWMHTDHTTGDALKVPETGPLGFMDAHTTTTTNFSGLPEKTTDVGLGADDWNNGTDEALFDLTGTVDPSYWSHTQWDDHDHDHEHHHNHDHHHDHDHEHHDHDHELNYLP